MNNRHVLALSAGILLAAAVALVGQLSGGLLPSPTSARLTLSEVPVITGTIESAFVLRALACSEEENGQEATNKELLRAYWSDLPPSTETIATREALIATYYATPNPTEEAEARAMLVEMQAAGEITTSTLASELQWIDEAPDPEVPFGPLDTPLDLRMHEVFRCQEQLGVPGGQIIDFGLVDVEYLTTDIEGSKALFRADMTYWSDVRLEDGSIKRVEGTKWHEFELEKQGSTWKLTSESSEPPGL